jgi:hypothetical protein
MIAADVFSPRKGTAIKPAKSVAQKPPPLTYDAKSAIREIETQTFGIAGKISALSEPALKGFAFEARERAKNDLDNPLWLGIANAADRRREILARHRTGKGVWYASVDVIRWDVSSGRAGQSESFAHERCNSKKEAEQAARRLLAEHANYFSAETSVEAHVVCDLEWQDDPGDDEG